MPDSKEKTFTFFTAEQAAAYAQNRGGSYPPIYPAILSYHQGRKERFLDVGTGPGRVVFDLLPDFPLHGYGCDTSASMIEQARKDSKSRGLNVKTTFAVYGGEDCAETLGSGKEKEEVDLITVAMAAHWLDMSKFYASAAKALRPGGTLAIWTASSYYCHPSTPHAKEIQAALSDLEDNMLGPYMTPGNALSRGGYKDLILPWASPSTALLFEQTSFERQEWDKDGIPSAPDLPDGTPGPFAMGSKKTDVEDFARGLGSASPVIRWREAHPDEAGGERDPVNLTLKRLRSLLGENAKMQTSASLSLILMRRVE